jgi:predicted transcriptional regulator
MRSTPTVLSPETQIGALLSQLKSSPLNAWPVVGKDGLTGMIRSSEIEGAAANGDSNKTVSEILQQVSQVTQTGEDLTHVHIDHSLALALERMGASGLNVLPVVSRANFHQLLGIIVLDDILNTYGVGKRLTPEEVAR